MSIDHGGPAFLIIHQTLSNGDTLMHPETGMTLRQWYAGRALAALPIQVVGSWGPDADAAAAHAYRGTAKIVAAIAYEIADAMITEGNKP